MKRLMWDYWRRWWWLLGLGAGFEFWLGRLIASGPAYGFEFWALMISLWTGANLLYFDLKRGAARAVLTLPLTAQQIGRGWWLAAVGIPAIGLAIVLFCGAGMSCYFDPAKAFPAGRLGIASLLSLVWLGTWFTATAGGNLYRLESSSERTRSGLINLLSMAMMFGSMMLCRNASKQPGRLILLLGVGGFLTVAGWFRAERFVAGCASARGSALRVHTVPGQHRVPLGAGAIPFLIRTSCVRGFLYVVAMVALMAVLMAWQQNQFPRPAGSVPFEVSIFAAQSSFMPAWFLLFSQLMPAIRQLRFWRTLPISASRLAAVMMATTILPLVALGVLVTGLTALFHGLPSALAMSQSFLFILVPISLCVAFAVWRGVGKSAYVGLHVILFGPQLSPLWLRRYVLLPELSLGPIAALAAFALASGFLLTWYLLRHNSQAYHFQAIQTDFLDPISA